MELIFVLDIIVFMAKTMKKLKKKAAMKKVKTKVKTEPILELGVIPMRKADKKKHKVRMLLHTAKAKLKFSKGKKYTTSACVMD